METTQVQNWFGNTVSSPSVIVEPRNVEELIAVLQDTQRYPAPVRAIGSNHSTTACGSVQQGTLVSMRQMNRIIEIRPDTVTVEAGALYIDVARELQKRNLQFYINIVIGNLTVGSAACCGTKDASMPGEFGQVCSYVTALKMVTPSGKIDFITENEPERLQAVRSSYGLFGIVYEVTLKVRPLQALSVYHRAYSLDEFTRQLPELTQSGTSMMLYIYPFLNKIMVEFRKYNSAASPKQATSWQWQVRNYLWKKVFPTYASTITRRVQSPAFKNFLLDSFNRLVIAASVFVLQGANTLPTAQQIKFPEQDRPSKFTFSFWAFPEENYTAILRDYFRFCRDYYQCTGYRSDMISVGYRVNADTSSLFSYSAGGPVITIDPVSTGNPGWEEFLVAYNQFCSQHGGVPLFNQTEQLTCEQVRCAFADRIQTFESYRASYDPKGRLLNDYFAQFFGPKHQA